MGDLGRPVVALVLPFRFTTAGSSYYGDRAVAYLSALVGLSLIG